MALLLRNRTCLGGWDTKVEDGRVSFACTYRAAAAAMTAGIFKTVCASLVAEVGAIENDLAAKGLL
jgi:hypothetical protein